jgi:hypothetical protein
MIIKSNIGYLIVIIGGKIGDLIVIIEEGKIGYLIVIIEGNDV